jgi:hypothetical protein
VALTRAEMDKKIDEHFAFEARDDVEGVLATLAPDAEHDIVGSPSGPTHGREGARDFYVGLFADLAESSVDTIRRLYGEDFVVDESLWRGRAPGTPFGVAGKNRPLEFRLLHIVQFTDNGDIQRENVWIDLVAILNQLPQD